MNKSIQTVLRLCPPHKSIKNSSIHPLQKESASDRLLPMFVTDGRTNYDRVFDELLAQFWDQNTPQKNNEVMFFEDHCVVRKDGIYSNTGRLDFIGGILILRYLFNASDEKIRNEWVPYREFKDGSNFATYIKQHIEDAIARQFARRRDALMGRLEALGGKLHPFESRPDLSMIIHAFPAIPILSVFWDEDEEFPPSFQFLFDRSAPVFLDMESLAVLLHYVYLKITEAV